MNEQYRIRVGGPKLSFSAGHFITFEDGGCEPLHGHDYRVTVELSGSLNPEGYLIDFTLVERELAALIEPLDHHTLVPRRHPRLEVHLDERDCELRLGDRHWLLPRDHCVLLPIENTTAEAVAAYLARGLTDALQRATGSRPAEVVLELHEGPGYSAICRLPG